MSKISLMLIGLLIATIIIPSALAQPEYLYGNDWGPITIFSDPKDPKIACDEFGNICVGVWWESNALFRGVRAGISYDRFETTPNPFTQQYALSSIDYSSYYSGYYDYYDLPYDVVYDDDTGEFRIFAFTDYNTLYRWNYKSGVGLTALSSSSYACFAFINATYAGCVRTRSYNDGGTYSIAEDTGFYNWDTGSFTQVDTQNVVTGGGGNWNCLRIHKAKGFATGDDDGNLWFKHKIELEYAGPSACTSSSTTSYTDIDLGSFSETYDGLFYWDGSTLYYRFVNASNETTSGVYRIDTTDFSTLGSPELYYNFDNTIAEAVNYTDYARSAYEVWTYERVANDSTSGLYSYNSVIIPVTYINRYETPRGETIPPQSQFTANINLECSSLNYSDSDSGTDGIVYTKCLDPTISITSEPGIVPTIYNGVINASGQSCSSMILDNLFTSKANFTLTVLDSFSGDPVEGATVILGSEYGTTDSNGEAVFYVNPVDNPSLDISNPSSCFFQAHWNGTARNFPLTITDDNYSVYSEIFTIMKTNQYGDDYFDLDKTVKIDPYAINALVEIETADGYEITPASALLRVNATIDAYYISPTLGRTVSPITSHQGNFPQQWQLFGNGTYLITFNLTYGGNEYSESVSATTPETVYVTFTVSQDFSEQYCEDSGDCTPSSCVPSTNTFLSLAGCFNYTCSYTEIECAECDPTAGCYDLPTSTPCSTNLDCLPLSTCTSRSSTSIGLCSSTGYCVLKNQVCEDYCETFTLDDNSTADTCEELFICSITGEVLENFAIYVLKNDVEVSYPPPPSPTQDPSLWRLAYSVRFACGIENVGTRTCIPGTTIDPVDIGTVSNSPLSVKSTIDWDYDVETNGDLRYYDLLVTCDQSCEIEYDFCPYGCVDGYCLQTPGGAETRARNVINSLENWWKNMFPDPYSQAFAWTVLTLLVSFGLSAGIAWLQRGSGNSMGGQEVGTIFTGSAIALFLLGVFLGTMPLFVGILFTALAGFLVWRIWT